MEIHIYFERESEDTVQAFFDLKKPIKFLPRKGDCIRLCGSFGELNGEVVKVEHDYETERIFIHVKGDVK